MCTDFVDDDVFVGDPSEGSIQAREELEHGFLATPHERHQDFSALGSQGATADRFDGADGDLAAVRRR